MQGDNHKRAARGICRNIVCGGIVMACLFGLSLCCCGQTKTNGVGNSAMNDTIVFSLPKMPQNLTEPQERAEYLAVHYWDNLNPILLRTAEDSTVLEQAFVDFLSVMPIAGKDVAMEAPGILLDKLQSEREAYSYMMDLAYKYLYDADSPMENEEMLVPYLEYATDTLREDDYIRVRAERMRDLVMRNRIGTKAADFHYVNRNGNRGSLWNTDAERLLVVFYDPECTHCTKIMAQLSECPAVADGRLNVLAVYTEGKKDVWESNKNVLPKNWTVVMDVDGINDDNIYDLKTMPTLYILDKDKKVLLKDVSVPQIINVP